MYFNENVLGGVDIYLQHACFVQRAIQKHQEALHPSRLGNVQLLRKLDADLVGNIGSQVERISSMLFDYVGVIA
jgi:hypothetical protein